MSGSNRDTWRPTLEGAVQMAPEGPPPKITAEEFRGKGRKAAMWPTPQAHDTGRSVEAYEAMRFGRMGRNTITSLAVAVQKWPTPTARDCTRGAGWDGPGRPLSETVGGRLNPPWVEWLMGYPEGWTDCGD
jgi:hypothetical protein